MKIKIKFQQGDYKATYKVKLSEAEKEKYKKNPISYCFNKMTNFLSTDYAIDWNKITNIEKAVYKQTLGKPLVSIPDYALHQNANMVITVIRKKDSQNIIQMAFDKENAKYWTSYVNAFLSGYRIDYDI